VIEILIGVAVEVDAKVELIFSVLRVPPCLFLCQEFLMRGLPPQFFHVLDPTHAKDASLPFEGWWGIGFFVGDGFSRPFACFP